MRGVILGPGEGVSVPNPVGGALTFKIGGAETNGALTAFESISAPGEGPPLHVHVNEDEIFYVLAGSFRFKLDGELRDAPAGFERFFELFAQISPDAAPADEFRRIGEETGPAVVGPRLAESDRL